MTMGLFDQFLSPQILGLPLVTLAMFMPVLLAPMSQRLVQNRMETAHMKFTMYFTKQLMTPLNKPGHTWALPLTMMMYYLLVTNLLGLLPYTFTPTTQLSLNMALAMPMWFTTVLIGLRTQPASALAHMLPTGTPTPLVPVLVIIETVSLFIRPVALGVRLTANLTAGHLLITLISTTTMVLLPITLPATALTMTLLIMLTMLEVAVAMIQAYVFVLLLSLYLQENT
uniref:ATP synthase subunit a n=1 Tax=Gehyra marginata TaxID=1074251 RepID=A0A7R7G248_9SAUR|nr:ATPase subunit 6 [Gehyra marginata]